jgi:hypothetical protein
MEAGTAVRRSTAVLLGLISVQAVALTFLFRHWTASGAWSFPVFVALTAVAVVLPGRHLLVMLGIAPNAALELLVLSLAAGMPLSGLAYFACGTAQAPGLFRAWPVLAAVLSLHPRLRPRPAEWQVWTTRYSHALLAIVLACALAPFAFLPPYFSNLSRTTGGELDFYPLVEVVLHGSYVNELTHTVPPQNAIVPGRALSYHFGMDLLAALYTPFGLDTMDLTVRFVPVLLMVFTVLATFCFARAWPLPEPAAVLLAFLVVLGEDFSFLPGLMLGSPEAWAVYFFGMPTTVSLYLLNPMLPAVGFLMAGLLSVQRFFESRRWEWLVLTGITSAALLETKVFVAAHLLVAAGIAALVRAAVARRLDGLRVAGAMALAMSPFAAMMWHLSAGRYAASIAPWPYVPAAFERMGLNSTLVGRLAGEFYLGRSGAAGALVFFGLATPAYLLLTFGARSLGLRGVWQALVCSAPAAPLRLLVAVLVAIGPVLSLLLGISPSGYPSRRFYNDAVWFLITAKHLMWFFAVEAVSSATRRGVAIAGAVLMIVLSLPATVDYFVRAAAERPARLEPGAVRMLDFVRREARPGSVCFARENVAQAIVVTTRCRVLALDAAAHMFVSPAEQAALRVQRDEFWAEWHASVRYDVLARLRVDYVIVNVVRDGLPGRGLEPTIGPLRLERRYFDPPFAVFQLVGAPQAGQP